ncbi:MAG: long-chain-fatty-acyl-CoA reductase [Alphaproteobacteria bacterium]|nr:long-chain-fatty-acyl-CoA reductase [Alphaproteobacteria bacterium]
MQQNFNDITFLTGNRECLEKATETKVLPVFSDAAVSFLSEMSNEILKDSRTKNYPDVAAYAFFLRKSSLTRLKEQVHNAESRIGRGIALHIAPSNVPVNFAVSFTDALLAGNINIVRVSDKPFSQVGIICDAINKVADTKYPDMKPYVQVVRYPHNDDITQGLSSMCDLRLIWGGNRTIANIRKAELPPRAIEYCFADRHSLAVIDADVYLKSNAEQTAKGFYIDTLYTDQNACSSPRLVVWTGKEIEKAKERFWDAFQQIAEKEYELPVIKVVDKLDALCRLAVSGNKVKRIGKSNRVVRVQVEKLTPDLMNFKESGGLFFEYDAYDLNEIVPILTKPCQTIAYFGVDKQALKNVIKNSGARGGDRVIPLGHTMDISILWDGLNMVEAMSRLIISA